MENILDAKQAKAVDTFSIECKKIPSLVLMERAALSVTARLIQFAKEKGLDINTMKVLCICGRGNNGADGVAVARQLTEKDISCEIFTAGGTDKEGTKEYELQLDIARNLGINIRNTVNFDEYNIIVDAIFGIGLSRDIQGQYKQVIENINLFKKKGYVISVDIPSGVNATNAHIMNCAVKADMTITFGYNKIGMVLYPGADYCGNIFVENIGFAKDAYKHSGISAKLITHEDIHMLPQRDIHGNKGAFGKTFIIAGSENMGGAACMSALAAYRSGNGLVKVFTHINNRNLVLSHVPEVIIECYDNEDEYNALENAHLSNDIEQSIDWSTCVIAGPGLSTSKRAVEIVDYVLDKIERTENKAFILDADALNIISSNESFKDRLRKCSKRNTSDKDGIKKTGNNIIITPHVGEMSRLTGKTIDEIKQAPVECAVHISKEYGVICVLKDARTIITDGLEVYINTNGNAGMATGGSGDVLTGILSGVINDAASLHTLVEAAAIGVYIHGMAGDIAKNMYGETAMKAMDIAQALPHIFKDYR